MSEPMTPPPVPGKKKMSPLGWVAIGCGAIAIVGILVLGGLAFMGGRFIKKTADKMEKNPTLAAAELMVRANPELEVVESDSDEGTLTIKNTKTGEVITMNAKDIEEGKLTFTTKEGTTTFDGSSTGDGGDGGTLKVTTDKGEEAVFGTSAGAPKNLPSWVPTYAGATIEGSYDATTAEGRSAMFTLKSTDSVDQVAEFYKSKLEGAGLKVERSSYETDGQKTIMLVGKTDDEKRNVNVTVGSGSGQTEALVNFNEKN
ncbi:MAG TPA: hypothetical protein VN493_01685 [Thermoanaerobaculia bacterium]|nr:hypothetical protein [Thermoanaerobaculia bacterium]